MSLLFGRLDNYYLLSGLKLKERLSIYVYGKRKTANSCVTQKCENLRFPTCLTLLISSSIYLVNRQAKFLDVLAKRKCNLAVNVMLNASVNSSSAHPPPG